MESEETKRSKRRTGRRASVNPKRFVRVNLYVLLNLTVPKLRGVDAEGTSRST